MKKNILFILAAFLMVVSCQDKNIEIADPILQAPNAESIKGELIGDDYVWTWGDLGGCKMQVTLIVDGTKSGSQVIEGDTYVHQNVDTNIKYQYIFKKTDMTNFSAGVIKEFTRPGATKVKSISMSQVDKATGYDALVEWDKAADATAVIVKATNGSGRLMSERLSGDATSYLIKDVFVGEEWEVTIVAENAAGQSLPTMGSLKIGKTAVAYLSVYDTAEELIANGDDDEISAWLWFEQTYQTGKFLPFSSIKSVDDVDPYRVLFWMRDLESGSESDVFTMPQVVMDALDPIKQWYTDGGSLLLWSHAMPFVATLGRIPMEAITSNDRTIGVGKGSFNGDVWKMAVQLNPGGKFKVDMSTHPLYKGLEVETTDRTKLIAMKGAGWAEDHNCLFFNYPSQLTGVGNQEEACYDILTNQYGIYPLGVWDSQIDWVSQLNIWEARQGDTNFKGTILCIGNGGCDFSMKSPDGEDDISAMPSNNAYQMNILTMAKNAIEYLKTR